MTHQPPGWGNDELSKFLQGVHDNQYGTFHNKKGWYERLSRIDGLFLRVALNIVNPKDPVATALFFRCHSAYRGACGAAMAGQVNEAFVLLRSCLEYAAYGLHIHANSGLDLLWLNRHDSEASLKAVRKEFAHGNLRDTISDRDSRLGEIFEELYQRSIDFGGHPNERAVSGSTKMENLEDRKMYLQIYLHGEGMQILHALKTTAQSGICALQIDQFMFKEKFELLGVRAELEEARQGL